MCYLDWNNTFLYIQIWRFERLQTKYKLQRVHGSNVQTQLFRICKVFRGVNIMCFKILAYCIRWISALDRSGQLYFFWSPANFQKFIFHDPKSAEKSNLPKSLRKELKKFLKSKKVQGMVIKGNYFQKNCWFLKAGQYFQRMNQV